MAPNPVLPPPQPDAQPPADPLARGEQARGGDPDTFARAIDVRSSRLRRKLHAYAENEIIRTFRGAGYMFDAKVTG